VVIEDNGAHAPYGKISEAFLDFASPLIEAAGPEAGNYELYRKDGEWILRAEARDPRRSSP